MVNYTGFIEGNSMTTPEVISTNSRSESAKKMWKERKAKGKEKQMIGDTPMKAWVYHTEWITLMVGLIGCFVFVHHENVHVTERLDNHIEAINRRVDEANHRIDSSIADNNRRSDEMRNEFYELLKEIRRSSS